MSINLTGKEIYDLAVFAGFDIKKGDVDTQQTEFTVTPCPTDGIKAEGEEVTYFSNHMVHLTEYPEEGVCSIGEVTTRTDTEAELYSKAITGMTDRARYYLAYYLADGYEINVVGETTILKKDSGQKFLAIDNNGNVKKLIKN